MFAEVVEFQAYKEFQFEVPNWLMGFGVLLLLLAVAGVIVVVPRNRH